MSFIDDDSAFEFIPIVDDIEIDITSINDDTTAIAAEAPLGIREFQSDFITTAVRIDSGLSLSRRPDAISFDYLTCFTLGPVALGDNSQGPTSHVWRVRQVQDTVFVARENGAGYNPDQVLFLYSGEVGDEIDAAFDQNGRVFICMERVGELWFYYYDPTIPAFAFQNFGAGKTPKAVLDAPLDSADSDVVVFYIRAGSLYYRLQRDRYLVEYNTGFLTTDNDFVEDVYKTTDERVHVLLSRHDTVNGTYSLWHIESLLYPVHIEEIDTFKVGLISLLGALESELEIHTLFDIDEFKVALSSLSGTLIQPLIIYSSEIDEFKVGLSSLTSTLINVIITHNVYDREDFKAALTPQTSTLVTYVIVHNTFDNESFKVGLTSLSGTLAP